MASEIFLAVFHARFDAPYDALNESGLRWWINENIRDFIAPKFISGNPLNACMCGAKDTGQRYSCG